MAVLAAFAGACATARRGALTDQSAVVYPAPPAPARIQFLTRISTSRDIAAAHTSFWARLVGKDEAESESIVKPYGIAIHHGRLYVCDTKLAGLEIIDLPRRTFEYVRPGGEGKLRTPINCFVDPDDGRLYVADPDRGQVVRFDSTGRYLDGFGAGAGVRPTDVFVRDGRVWVSDIGTRTIRAYDKHTLQPVLTFPSRADRAAAALFQPTNLYVTGDRVYVSDMGDFRVKIYSRDGTFIRSLGSQGTSSGQFARPKGVAVARDGTVYVVDAAFENVQVFDSTGRLLLFFGGSYRGPGDMWLPAKVVVDYDNLRYFEQYVDRRFTLKYLILVSNQYGPDKVSVYGFVEPRENSASAR